MSRTGFDGFRLYLIRVADGMPIGWELAGANAGERAVTAEMRDRIPNARLSSTVENWSTFNG